MMLGYLLARAGVDVVVLEKHADFFRDFRGDTIHPSTLEVMHELGILDEFLKRPHQEVSKLTAWIEDFHATIADFSHLPTQCKFVAFTPQWEFLNFIAENAAKYSSFHLRMNAEVTDLVVDGDAVTGVTAQTPQGPITIKARLVVGCDGRGSKVRERAGLETINIGAPMDVLWMRVAKGVDDRGTSLGRISRGHILVFIDRDDYWQLGFVIPKGGRDEWQRRGLPALREELRLTAPFLGERVEQLRTWDDVKLLTVRVDRLKRWYKRGLLCIGDAAHAMSPVGGVGINLAIQDAVAAANLLAEPLHRGTIAEHHLKAVERRRESPTRSTQRMQVFIQNRIISRVLAGGAPTTKLPLPIRILQKFPRLQRIPGRLLGLGFRPEHVESIDARVQC